MTSTHQLIFCLILIGFGVSQCNQYRPNKLSQTDSTLIELSTRITLLETDNRRVKNELDSLKDQINQDYYANSCNWDYVFPVAQRADSFLVKESGRGRFWRKVGRNYGYAREGLGAFGVRLP